MNVKTCVFALFICVFSFGWVQANPIQIRLDQRGRSLTDAPVLNQGALGICYAYTATQIWDAYRKTRTIGSFHYTSPEYLAVMSSRTKMGGDGDFESGFISKAIQYLNQHGNCRKRNLDSRPEMRDEVLKKIAKYYVDRKQLRSPGDLKLEPDVLLSPHARLQAEYALSSVRMRKLKDDAIQFLSDAKISLDYERLDSHFGTSSDSANFQAQVLQLQCSPDEMEYMGVPLETMEISFWRMFLNEKLDRVQATVENAKMLNEVLIKSFEAMHPLPVGIEYCADMLTDGPDTFGIDKQMKGKSCGIHASVLAGIEYDSNGEYSKTKVLIRNSWGESCESYDPGFKCIKGQVWVPLTTLSKNLFRVVLAR